MFFFAMAALLWSCNGSEDPIIPEPIIPELSATPVTLSYEVTGGEQSINISSNTIWTIKSSADWCRSAIQTSKGDAVVNITVDSNTIEEKRKATITISALDVNDVLISVTQAEFIPDPEKPEVPDSIAPDMTGMEGDALDIASNMFLGWNLGNTMEAIGGETAWGNPKTTEELILTVKEAGINAVRIPCSWDQYLENQTDYKIKESWMERVTEVVDYCVNNEMYVVLNIHWDGGWMENNCTPEKEEEVSIKLAAIWKQIAINFRDYNEYLLFAGANEPNADDQQQADVLTAHLQTFVNVVRATGGRNYYRNLIVQAPYTDIDKAEEWMMMPADKIENRLFAEVHYYSPYQFCLMNEDADWGKMAYFWGEQNHVEGAGDRNATWGEEDYMEAQFEKMKSKFVDNGIPVILGEFAVIKRDLSANTEWQQKHDDSRAYFYKNVTKRSKNNGLIPFFWDTGDGIIDRSNNVVFNTEDYNALIAGATEGVYPFNN